MIISHFGKQHFKIQQGDLTISLNPISKDSKEKSVKYGADIVFVTINSPDYNGIENCEHGDRKPLIINGPGEYEIRDIFIKGFSSIQEINIDGKNKNKIKMQNASYVFTIDGIRILFLGYFNGDLTSEQREIIDEIDILFIPVSNNENLLNSYDANKLATKLEPSIIIPMDYDNESLKIFLKETGNEKVEKIDKLTIKKKDIENKQGEVVVFDF